MNIKGLNKYNEVSKNIIILCNQLENQYFHNYD